MTVLGRWQGAGMTAPLHSVTTIYMATRRGSPRSEITVTTKGIVVKDKITH